MILQKLFAAIVALFVSILPCDAPTTFTGQSPYTSICQVQVGGAQGSGTLIAINDGQALVLTCRHVAEKAGAGAKCEWLGADGQKTQGEVLIVVPGRTFNNDLALIVCEAPVGVTPLIVAKFDPANGPWYGVGWRGGQMYEAVSDEASEDDGAIKFNSPLIGGQSGGALLDKNGCLVGVTVGSNMTSFGIAANGRYLAGLLAAHTK